MTALLALLFPIVRAVERRFEVTIDAAGRIFVAGEAVDEAGLRERVRRARARQAALVACVSADERAARGRVLHVLDVLRQEWDGRHLSDDAAASHR